MEQSIGDILGSVVDEADEIDVRRGEYPNGATYEHARIRGFDDDLTEKYEQRIRAEGYHTAVNEYSRGLEIEVWE